MVARYVQDHRCYHHSLSAVRRDDARAVVSTLPLHVVPGRDVLEVCKFDYVHAVMEPYEIASCIGEARSQPGTPGCYS